MSSSRHRRFRYQNYLLPWADVFTIILWGILLLKYWLTGKLYLLIHPDYFWLVIAAGFTLIGIGTLKGISLLYNEQTLKRLPKALEKGLIASLLWFIVSAGGVLMQFFGFKKGFSLLSKLSTIQDELLTGQPEIPNRQSQHITIFPPGWSTALLLSVAIVSFIITPRYFNSQTALDRGITDTLFVTRSQPQEFKSAKPPEERSLIEWVRTLNAYPEPDAYTGQKVKVQGFAIHPQELAEEYILLSRFVLTCCAADAYPVGLPVKLTSSRNDYKPDTWLEVEGVMMTETLAGKRQLTIQANSIKTIPEPKNPYDY